jgi:septal ring factor EnvC (AmiA/AmiB activator)
VRFSEYLILFSFLVFAATPAWSAAAGAKEELQQLRARIESLQKELAAAEESRNEAADALRESERAISEASRELAELERLSRTASQRAEVLRAETRKAGETLQGHQTELARLVYLQYVQQGGAAPDALRLVLSGENPNDIARDLHYLGYVSRAHGAAIAGMRESLKRLKALSDETVSKAKELAGIGAAQLSQRQRLEAEKRKRAEVVARLSRDIARQRREIGAMQRNETRLTTLIEQLARVIARPATAPREKAATPRPRGERNERKEGKESVPEPTIPSTVVQVFSKLRGQLALPVRGELAGRFGSPRSDGGLTWKGLFVTANAGVPVRAVAAGRVVYADWLRGFGNLLIVDHGEGYMSLYGYNETLLKQVGEEIHGGDTVATVGNSGGSGDSGLYFELRHQGKPFDPLTWVGRR